MTRLYTVLRRESICAVCEPMTSVHALAIKIYFQRGLDWFSGLILWRCTWLSCSYFFCSFGLAVNYRHLPKYNFEHSGPVSGKNCWAISCWIIRRNSASALIKFSQIYQCIENRRIANHMPRIVLRWYIEIVMNYDSHLFKKTNLNLKCVLVASHLLVLIVFSNVDHKYWLIKYTDVVASYNERMKFPSLRGHTCLCQVMFQQLSSSSISNDFSNTNWWSVGNKSCLQELLHWFWSDVAVSCQHQLLIMANFLQALKKT